MAFINAIKRYWQETGIIFAGRFKKFVLTAPFWILIIAVAMLVTGIIRYNILTDARPEQYMAEYWGQDSSVSYRQLTVFSRGYRSGGSIPVPVHISNTGAPSGTCTKPDKSTASIPKQKRSGSCRIFKPHNCRSSKRSKISYPSFPVPPAHAALPC